MPGRGIDQSFGKQQSRMKCPRTRWQLRSNVPLAYTVYAVEVMIVLMRQVRRYVGTVACVCGQPRQPRLGSWRFIQNLRLNPHNQSLIWRHIAGLIREDTLAVVVCIYGDHAVTPLHLRAWHANCHLTIFASARSSG